MSDSNEKTAQTIARDGNTRLVLELNADEILAREFEYIAQTAFQANEDRARVASFYLVTLGSLVAAALSTQIEDLQVLYVYGVFAILFGALTIASVVTVLQLVRLRQAWFDSILAMNQIKEYYIQRLPQAKIEEALAWRSNRIPPRFKPWSISSLLTLQIALLGGVTVAATVIFAGLAYSCSWWGYALVAGIITCVLEIWLYWRLGMVQNHGRLD